MNADDEDDPVLLHARGERDAAARALRRRYGRFVHGVVLAHAPARLADEIADETLDFAAFRLGTLRDPAALPAWLARTAQRRALDALRDGDGTVGLDGAPEPVDRRGAAAAAAAAEAREALDAIKSLPVAYRETLVLRLVEGLSGIEIATLTGLTPGSVRVNLHRGMALLRAKLEGVPVHE